MLIFNVGFPSLPNHPDSIPTKRVPAKGSSFPTPGTGQGVPTPLGAGRSPAEQNCGEILGSRHPSRVTRLWPIQRSIGNRVWVLSHPFPLPASAAWAREPWWPAQEEAGRGTRLKAWGTRSGAWGLGCWAQGNPAAALTFCCLQYADLQALKGLAGELFQRAQRRGL